MTYYGTVVVQQGKGILIAPAVPDEACKRLVTQAVANMKKTGRK